jgi:hypothetical protein
MNLYLLSIEAAEEIQRLRLKKDGSLKYTNELSELIKKDFNKRLDCSVLFSEAYFGAYSKRISVLPNDNSIQHMIKISNKLGSVLSLKDEDLEKLVDFCVNLSDYSALYEKEIVNIKSKGCFT